MREKIRNFAIIAHIDHGKSTLADRFLEITGTVSKDKLVPQYLDRLSLEREKGITIKMQPVTMEYQGYILNLIDTPGHIDFNYEVSRALAAVEGVILLIDGTQGVQAQTIHNLELAKKQNLVIIPAINKIDLEIHNLDDLLEDIYRLTGEREVYLISAKLGTGAEELLKAVIEKIPFPNGCENYPDINQIKLPGYKPDKISYQGDNISGSHPGNTSGQHLGNIAGKALVFDSHFDSYKGIIAHVRIFEGEFRKFQEAYLRQAKYKFKILEVGIFKPELEEKEKLESGMIGYLATGIKDPGILKIGETITFDLDTEPLSGYQEPKPVVFASVFPSTNISFENFENSLKKFQLQDPSIYLEKTNSPFLGKGYNVGAMGLLHLEIFEQRLKREFQTDIILTLPSIRYKAVLKNNQEVFIINPNEIDLAQVLYFEEPFIEVEIFTPITYSENIFSLIRNSRGIIKNQVVEGSFLKIVTEMPLEELISGFYDELKSVSSGYASLRWQFLDYRKSDLVKLDILIAEQTESSLSRIIHRDKAEKIGRKILLELKENLPREEFAIKLQAAINNRIIARETIPALRKDVAGWLYGGDRTRKMKLWQKQKEGKKKLQELGKGKVKIPNDVLLKILKVR
ncbi:MAG: elongation factor 4 [Candidatus Parcubacteria bacterium]|nr:MAG: elongation factor 4 [Candidatus Parcubacteria bacterium]